MSSDHHEEADVVVVGGGPGGSTLAALVAMRGWRVVVLEKEKFPRYQIGESLLPATVHGVCRLTGAAQEVARAGFTVKRGGTFRWGANEDPWTFSFSISQKMAGETSFAYQVERSKFDAILLENARRAGAEVREQCTAIDVVEDGGRVRGVVYADTDGTPQTIRATYVIDASGNKSRMHGKVGGQREYSDFFRSLALFGYFESGKRLPPPNSGNILSVAFDSGWFWYIPLSASLTSVGAVVTSDMAEKVQGDPEEALNALIDECSLIREYLHGAKRITEGQYGQLRVRKDYSYRNTRFWRPGMALIGDAACFVDPVFSSGVHLATYSALLAARSINSVLDNSVDEQSAFQEFEHRYRREYSVFYEFLMSFYNMHSNEDSYFWSAKKVIRSSASELESFVDLVGGVSSGEAALAKTPAITDQLSSRTTEFSDAIDKIVANKGESMLPLFKSSVVREAMTESGRVQSMALLGNQSSSELPLIEGGLIPSEDGMSWRMPPGGGPRHG